MPDKRLRYELRPDKQERQPQAGISLPEPGEAPYGQWSGGEAGAGRPQTQQWQVSWHLAPALHMLASSGAFVMCSYAAPFLYRWCRYSPLMYKGVVVLMCSATCMVGVFCSVFVEFWQDTLW